MFYLLLLSSITNFSIKNGSLNSNLVKSGNQCLLLAMFNLKWFLPTDQNYQEKNL